MRATTEFRGDIRHQFAPGTAASRGAWRVARVDTVRSEMKIAGTGKSGARAQATGKSAELAQPQDQRADDQRYAGVER